MRVVMRVHKNIYGRGGPRLESVHLNTSEEVISYTLGSFLEFFPNAMN